eukprot:904258-Amphidinium_carterae.1
MGQPIWHQCFRPSVEGWLEEDYQVPDILPNTVRMTICGKRGSPMRVRCHHRTRDTRDTGSSFLSSTPQSSTPYC